IVGVAEICERYSIATPEQLIDILGLWGDASDNIPGVPGIGEKTAAKLISTYGSVEKLLENTHELKGKQKENLENFAEQALQSKQLATIITDVPIDFEPEKLKLQSPDMEKLQELFDELEFKTFAKRMFQDAQKQSQAADQQDLFSDLSNEELDSFQEVEKHTILTTKHEYQLVDDEAAIKVLVVQLSKEKNFCFDTETTAIDAHTAELVGISFAIKAHHGWYVPMPENYHDCQQKLSHFKSLFENEAIEKTGQNLKYDIAVLKWYDIEVKGPLFDTIIAHYLLQPDQRHNMDFLAETYLNYQPVSIESLIGKKGKNQGSMRDIEVEKVKEYATEDADITLQLRQKLEQDLSSQGVRKIFDEIE
ncbi:MAG: DNA polymerase I, partial [Bacteroidales bacterium]|nr:DNA polymerase I [Bacteroidales bacterium]